MVRGVSRGHRSGSLAVVNLSFLDLRSYNIKIYLSVPVVKPLQFVSYFEIALSFHISSTFVCNPEINKKERCVCCSTVNGL
jgi:hypothetical protein